MVKELLDGHYYIWVGPKNELELKNWTPEMSGIFDGLPHKFECDGGNNGTFDNLLVGNFYWNHVLEYFIDVTNLRIIYDTKEINLQLKEWVEEFS